MSVLCIWQNLRSLFIDTLQCHLSLIAQSQSVQKVEMPSAAKCICSEKKTLDSFKKAEYTRRVKFCVLIVLQFGTWMDQYVFYKAIDANIDAYKAKKKSL